MSGVSESLYVGAFWAIFIVGVTAVLIRQWRRLVLLRCIRSEEFEWGQISSALADRDRVGKLWHAWVNGQVDHRRQPFGGDFILVLADDATFTANHVGYLRVTTTWYSR
jgi:hypothetical protein